LRTAVYSSFTLENWDWTAKDRGIGGSERSHIEIVSRLGKRGHKVISYSPVPSGGVLIGPHNVPWQDHKLADTKTEPMNWIVFRDPSFLNNEFHPSSQIFFVAQDVSYPFTEEQLAKIDRYICLCKTHVQYTQAMYPQLKDKTFLSTNGIPVDDILRIEKENIPRNPNKLIYASSPDRGLLLVLKNWFRIREQCPEAELSVAYGFANMLKILELQGGNAWFVPMKEEIERLMSQPGVNFLGRIGQDQLFREYLSSNIWWYPTDWPETSCCVSMEAQAMGCIPVFTRYWALEQNVFHGFGYPTIPQNDPLTRSLMCQKVCDLIKNPQVEWRNEMMQDARDTFDWDRVVAQYEGWLK